MRSLAAPLASRPMRTKRSTFGIALALAFTSAAGVAIAAESSRDPGADGWYDASPSDASFRVRMPAVSQAFTKDGTNDAGVATHTVGVRADVTAAFGGQTNYLASCTQQEHDERTAKERLQAIIDRWTRLGRVRYRSQLGADSQFGFEFEIVDDVKVIRSRIYAPDSRTCTVLLSWRPYAQPSDADIEKYLGSFVPARR
jgi:hypothetical protein